MNDQKNRKDDLLQLELWSLEEWRNHRQAPFDLKKDSFSVAWNAHDGGFMQFRLVNGGDYEIGFQLHEDGHFRGVLEVGRRRFEFLFKVTGANPKVMKGDFLEVDVETGPDPVASWGAEERGGGPVFGNEGHGRGERRPEANPPR